MSVGIEGSGPSQADLSAAVTQALGLCQVRGLIGEARYRVLSSQFQSEPHGDTKQSSDMYQATVYDYTRGRTILVNGVPFDPTTVSVSEANTEPFTNADELLEAGRIAGAQTSEVVRSNMPPLAVREFPDGTSHRILNIAITSANSTRAVSVNMNNRTVEHQLSHSGEPLLTCDAPPPAGGSSGSRGIPGSANIVITQSGKILWTFKAIRPSASSGTTGSGIELRNVKYKGKTVLYQAHVPTLNVEYEEQGTGCGPHYRDWQYEEWRLQCDGQDIAPGFRLCKSPAKTILDSGIDGGNFMGVAVYIEGQEVVLKAQMIAGWYRYVSEWRFHVDGTLRPRFGFGAVQSANMCVCHVHHHHAYWRLDFDIVSPGNNLVREYNKPPIIDDSNYHDKIYEIRRLKDSSHQRHWEISNTITGNSYSLTPGPNDGTSDSFGVGDLWVLRYHAGEIDDGIPRLLGTSEAATKARIDNFLNGELVKDKDVVIWYAAHFKHDHAHGGGGSHVVGPDIKPLKW